MKTKVVAFSGQKGGIGKSSIAIITASYLHYFLRKKVIVLDADSPQFSLWTFRNQELLKLQKEISWAEAFENQGIEIYPIERVDLETVPRKTEELRASKKYDYILVDTPGTVNVRGYKEFLMSVEVIFMPMQAEEFSLNSSLEFINYINTNVLNVGRSNLKEFYVFWNRIVSSENRSFFIDIHKMLINKGISVLDQLVPERVDYKRSSCRSSLFPFSSKFQDSPLSAVIKAIAEILEKN